MSSSESSDDFESADEDFDQTARLSSSMYNQFKNKDNYNLPNLGQENVTDDETKCVIQSLKNINLEVEKTNRPTPVILKEEVEENSEIPVSCDTIKAKLPKKLGTKLCNDKVVSSKVGLHTNTSLIDSKGYKVANDHKSQNSQKNVDNAVTESSSIPQQPPSDKSQSSDGWALDEEDEFLIQSDLSKTIQLKETSWSGWGGWRMSTLLTTATDSVSTFSNHVTAGLSTVLETTVGAPDPETLAAAVQLHQADTPTSSDQDAQNSDDVKVANYGTLGSLVSGVSFIGSSVINRGLDTLESLGKKTMEVLQEGDPGLKKKRAIFFSNEDKTILSQILREAKEKADHSDKEKEEKEMARKAHFESLFDDFQGMVHLEALEMLSTQCELKLQSLLLGESGTAMENLQEVLSQVRDLCELPDEEEEFETLTQDQFSEQITKCVDGLKINISATKIIQVNKSVATRLSELSSAPTDIHQTAISSLAEFTAAVMEYFHKSAELLLAKTVHSTADESEHYVKITGLLCARESAIANDFTQLLTKYDPIANSSLITNIFLEASNSCSYTRTACQLLTPILQVSAVAS